MKLNPNFITQVIDDVQFLIPIGGEAFSGIVRSNETAAFIVDALGEDVTEEEIVEKLLAEYEGDRGEIAEDVHAILEKLRSINALDE
ncbi:MAG: PqqD family protein [Clostridia bacterium]|nr:PqqD family protein [Clostridia bacterium]